MKVKTVQELNMIEATTARIRSSEEKFNRIVHNHRGVKPFDPNQTQNIYGIDYWDMLSIPQKLAYDYDLVNFTPNGQFIAGIFNQHDKTMDDRIILIPRTNTELMKKANVDIHLDSLLRFRVQAFFPQYRTYNIAVNAESDGAFIEIIPYCESQCYFCGGPIYEDGYKYFDRHICGECAEEIWEAVELTKKGPQTK